MKVLILGSKGSLGQEFVKLYHDAEVTAWDRNDLDITDEAAVAEKIKYISPDLIINCAAYNAVDKAEDERAVAENINGYAVGFIAKAASACDAILVHYSTGQVFDGSKQAGYNEDDETKPANAYGQSKLLGEIELQKNAEKFYLIRTSWLFGRPAGKKSFVDMMLDMAAADQTINAVQDELGKPTYTVDLAQATRALIEQNKPCGIYHLTNSGMTSRYDWAKEIFETKQLQPRLTAVSADFFQRKAARPKYEVLNNTKFIELRPWTEALREYLNN